VPETITGDKTMPNNHVRAAAEGMPNDDPAAKIGMELIASMARDEALQVASYEHKRSSNNLFDIAMEHEQDRSYALRDLLSTTKATTLTGAAFQLCEAVSRVDIIRDQYPEDAMGYRAKQDIRVVMRLLYSAIDVIDGLMSPKLTDLAPTYLGANISPWNDPYEETERRLRADEERAAKKGGA